MSIVQIDTNLGSFSIRLFPNHAPVTVKNFTNYVLQGFYDGTIFHRVIPGFMVQGGGFTPGMNQKETSPQILNEADNGLKNIKYSVAMARTSDPHSATSQFFINVADNDFLNFKSKDIHGWGYAVFAEVIDNKEVIDNIACVTTGINGFHKDVPVNDVQINTASLLEI